MGKLTTSVVAVSLFLVLGSSLSAQSPAPVGQKELTIEELFLQSVEFQVLREKAFSEDYDVKMSALNELEKKITSGAVGDSATQLEFILEYLALEGSLRVVREAGRQVNNFPEVRRKAVQLLGKLGGRDAMRALITVLLGDREPTVKSEAVYGLGVIGLNENNDAVQAIAFALSREDPAMPDNNFGFAIALAIEKINQKTGGIKDPAAYQTLVRLAQGNYIKSVKTKALQVLDEMKQAK
jgi:HEAT repeat protein